MEKEYKQIIIIRKDLKMRTGKAIAQGAHASMAAILNLGKETEEGLLIPKDPRIWEWLKGNFKKITVYVESEQELLDFHAEAQNRGLVTVLILDSGLTEFKKPTHTAVAIGPDLAENINPLTSHLKLL